MFGRYKVVKQDNPVTVVSFLNREKGSLSYLLSHIEDEQIIFLKDAGNLGLQDILCRMSLADSNIPLNWQEELKLILKERVSDKLRFVEFLISDERERNYFFIPIGDGQKEVEIQENIYKPDDELLKLFNQNELEASFFLFAVDNFDNYANKNDISMEVKFGNIYYFLKSTLLKEKKFPPIKSYIAYSNKRYMANLERLYSPSKSETFKVSMEKMYNRFKEIQNEKTC